MSLARLARPIPTRSRVIATALPASRSIGRINILQRTTSTRKSRQPLPTTSSADRIIRRAYASTATATIETRPEPSFHPSAPVTRPVIQVEGAQTLTPLLERIKEVLENDIGGVDSWSRRIDASLEDLSAQRRGRIGVIGDALAAPHDVVSALLQDPLADSESTRRALLDRHEGSNIDVFTLRQGIDLVRDPEALSLQSSWLQASGYDVIEVGLQEAESATSNLLSTDAVIVVLDPIRLADTPQLSSILPTLLARGSIDFVINGALPPRTTSAQLDASLRRQLGRLKVELADGASFDPNSIGVSFVQANRALDALDALAAGLQDQGPSSSQARAKAFEVFQKQFLGSHIGPLQASLLEAMRQEPTPQLRTATQTAALALSRISSIIAADRDTVRTVSYTASELRRSAMQGASKAKHLSVASRGIEGGVVEGGVQHEMDKIKRGIQLSFDGRLSWLGLIARARVDDVAAELGAFLGSRFAVDLERQLIFETGQLSQLQTSLSTSADHTIRQLSSKAHQSTSVPSHPFTSPLLLNHLQTLSLSVPPFAPTELLEPILTRRSQLLSQSVPRLQLSAQRALLTTYATSLLGISASWMSYVQPLEIVSGSTAWGLGILSVVASLAAGQRLWGRAQRRFWRDYKRITEMMKGDLETRFQTALDTQILAKPLAAAEGLETLIRRREQRLDQLQDKVDGLASRIRHQGSI